MKRIKIDNNCCKNLNNLTTLNLNKYPIDDDFLHILGTNGNKLKNLCF